MKKGECRGCGEDIVWITTPKGKLMPCNPTPVVYWEKKGAVGKVVTPTGDVLSCEFEGPPGTATGIGYTSHFSSCPQAGQFRKKAGR